MARPDAAAGKRPQFVEETVALSGGWRQRTACGTPSGSAGKLRKLGIRANMRTVWRHMRAARPPRRAGQTWATFLRNHARATWACDFLPVTDLLFRPLHAFVVVALGSRRVVYAGVTRHPTDALVAQQLREATPFDQRPRLLIRDRDSKYGPAFALCWLVIPSGPSRWQSHAASANRRLRIGKPASTRLLRSAPGGGSSHHRAGFSRSHRPARTTRHRREPRG